MRPVLVVALGAALAVGPATAAPADPAGRTTLEQTLAPGGGGFAPLRAAAGEPYACLLYTSPSPRD